MHFRMNRLKIGIEHKKAVNFHPALFFYEGVYVMRELLKMIKSVKQQSFSEIVLERGLGGGDIMMFKCDAFNVFSMKRKKKA